MKYSTEVIEKIKSELLDEFNGLVNLFPKSSGLFNAWGGQDQPNNYFIFIDNGSFKDSDMNAALDNVIVEDNEHQFACRIGTKTQLSPIYDNDNFDIEDFDDQEEPSNLEEIEANIDEIIGKVTSYISQCKSLRADGYQVDDANYAYLDIFFEFSLSVKAKRQLKISTLVS